LALLCRWLLFVLYSLVVRFNIVVNQEFLCVHAKYNLSASQVFLVGSYDGKKIKHEALGCRVGKKSAFKFIGRPVVSIIVCQFNGCRCRLLRLPLTHKYTIVFDIYKELN